MLCGLPGQGSVTKPTFFPSLRVNTRRDGEETQGQQGDGIADAHRPYLRIKPSTMAQHIGIVACSAEGAALCYRSICVGGADLLGPHDHPEISMHTHSLAEYMKCIDRDDWQGVGELMLSSANKLAKIGADFLICPDNTIHQALPYIESQLPLKWLHIAEAVAAQAVGRGFRRLGLTGTRYLVESEVYPEKLKARKSGVCAPQPGRTRRDQSHHHR